MVKRDYYAREKIPINDRKKNPKRIIKYISWSYYPEVWPGYWIIARATHKNADLYPGWTTDTTTI